MSIAASGLCPALEDIAKKNSLPCVLPDERGRQFRVRGDVRATLLCGLEAPSDNRPSARAKATAQARRYGAHFHRFRVPPGGMTTALKISRLPESLSRERRLFSWFLGEPQFMTTLSQGISLKAAHG